MMDSETSSIFESGLQGVYTARFSVDGPVLRFSGTLENQDCTISLVIENSEGRMTRDLTTALPEELVGLKHGFGNGFVFLGAGENRITITARNENGDEIGKETFAVNRESATFESKGVVFEISGEGAEAFKRKNADKLEEAAAVLDEINPLLDEDRTIGRVRIYADDQTDAANEKYEAASRHGLITISGNRFSYGNTAGTIAITTMLWHEGTHAFSKQLEEKNPEFKNDLKSRFDKFGKRESLFALFDESSYIPGIPPKIGHPQDGPNELFASASVVLRYFPEKFMEKVGGLTESERKVVIEAARFVVAQYPKNMFSPELHKFLEEKKQEKPALSLR